MRDLNYETASLFFIILEVILGLGGVSVALSPSTMPLATVVAAFAIPAILIWWGLILLKKN